MDSYIYLISDQTYTKMAKGNDPQQHLTRLQAGSPKPLQLIGTVHYKSEFLAEQAENRLHKRYANKQTSPKWFILTKKDIKDILAATKHLTKIKNKDTEVSLHLQEQLEQGLQLKHISAERSGMFVTSCIKCNKQLELKNYQLLRHIDNICDDCRPNSKLEAQYTRHKTRATNKQYKRDNDFMRKYYKHTARKMHTIRYDYSKTITLFKDNIVAKCPKHGIFTTNAIDHIHGKACPQCPQPEQPVLYRYTTNDNTEHSGYLPLKVIKSNPSKHDYIKDLATYLTGPGSHKETTYLGVPDASR